MRTIKVYIEIEGEEGKAFTDMIIDSYLIEQSAVDKAKMLQWAIQPHLAAVTRRFAANMGRSE